MFYIGASLRHSLRMSFGSYRDLTKTLISIQSQSSLNEKRHLFQQYYSSQSKENQESIRAILQFIEEKPKTGIATKSLANYLSSKFLDDPQVKTNDLEQAITQIFKNKDGENAESDITNEEVIEILKELKQLEGNGSIGVKMDKIGTIIRKMTSDEARIFTRIVVKNMRIGLKINWLNQQDQKSQSAVKPNQASHLDIKQFRGIDLMLSKPLKKIQDLWQFCDKKVQANPQKNNILADLKYDGERSLIIYERGKGLTMMSRRHKTQQQVYKHLARKIETQLMADTSINSIQLDGEIVCVNASQEQMPMQYILNLRGKEEENPEYDLLLFCFDVIEYNGQKLFQTPLDQRRALLPTTKTIRPSHCQYFTYPEEKDKLLDYFLATIKQKYEGLIIKGATDEYHTNGSRKHWGKLKKGCQIEDTDTGEIDLDLVVMGVDTGKGKKSSTFAAFLLGAYHEGQLYPITKVGSGFTDQEAEDLTQMFKGLILQESLPQMVKPKYMRVQHYVRPEIVFKVRCQDLTRSPLYDFGYREGYGGISLRFPVFDCIRQDKSPQSCKADVLLDLSKDI